MSPRIGFFIFAVILSTASIGNASGNAQTYEVFNLGLELERQLYIYEARELYLAVLDESPLNTGYLSHYAWFLTTFGFTEEAAEVFERLLPLSEDKAAVYSGIGWTRQALGQLELSIDAFRQCFSITALDQKNAFEQIQWQQYQENHAKIERLKSLNAQGINSEENSKALLKVYLDQGEFSNVISLAEDLEAQGALDTTSRLWLARALFWSGDLRRAESEYRALMDRSPSSAFLLIELAEVFVSDGRIEEACSFLKKALEYYPGATIGRKKLAEVLAIQGDGQSALRMADTIDDGTVPDRLTGLMARARARHFSGDVAGAQFLYADILKDYPYLPDALWGMTETSIYSGRYGDALQTLSRWEGAAPQDTRLGSQQLLAERYTAPRAETKFDFYRNSSDFLRMNAGQEAGIYIGGDTCLKAGYQFSKFSQTEFEDTTRHAIFLSAQQNVSAGFQVYGRVAGNSYNNDHRTLNGQLAATLQVSQALSIRPYYRHLDIIDTVAPFENAVYSHVVTIGSVGMGITADSFGMRAEYTPRPRLSFSGDYEVGEYSDDNRKQTLNFGADYRLVLQPDWHLAYNYFFLDYRDPAPLYVEGDRIESAYYDPIGFETHTLRVVFRDDDGDHFRYGGEGAVSFIPECSGIGTYLSAYFEWCIRDKLTFRADARWFSQDKGIDRQGTTDRFNADNILFEFDYRF